MQIDLSQDDIKGLLINPKSASKNHYVADCPFCGKKEHMYFSYVGMRGDWKKCGLGFNLYQYLRQIGRLDLVEFGKTLNLVTLDARLKILEDEEVEEETILPTINLPFGCKRVYDHPYLNERGFDEDDYFQTKIYINESMKAYRNYVFICFEEDKRLVGYIARSCYSKEETKALKDRGIEVLRYKNSVSEFSHILSGEEDFEEGTKTAILTEGYFDKKNTDKQLNLKTNPEIKAVCTFGKKISKVQIKKMIEAGIENVIVLYDGDAITEVKRYSIELAQYFNVLGGFIPDERDPGSLSEEEFVQIFANLKNPTDFYHNYIQPIKFK